MADETPIPASSKSCACGAPGWRWIAADPDIAPFVQCEPCAMDFQILLMRGGVFEDFEKAQAKRRKKNERAAKRTKPAASGDGA